MAKRKEKAPAQVRGYRPRLRYRWVTIPDELIEPEEGGEPFKAKIQSHLTFGQIDDIPFGTGVRYAEIEEAVAPYVVEWNVLAINDETGELEPVPPPAEAGVEVFKCIAGFELEWLAIELRKSTLGSIKELRRAEEDGTITPEQAETKKSSTPSGPTPEPGDNSSST